MAGPAVQAGAYAEHPEALLVARAAGGDRAAYGELLERRLEGLYRTAFAILRSDADARDAVQDACVRAWRDLRRLRDVERFDAWLGRVLLNACRDQLRSRRRIWVREISLVDERHGERDIPSGGKPLAEHVADLDAVRRAFLRLRPDERVIIALHHAERRPLDEISTLLDVPLGTVKWRLHAARNALAKALERER